MKEFVEFRVDEKYAHRLFSEQEGKKIGNDGSVRKIIINTADPRFVKIGMLQKKLQTKRRLFGNGHNYFFAGWEFERKYSKDEFDRAELYNFTLTKMFQPCGVECGTLIDESTTCKFCGSGAVQVGPLRLLNGSIPKSKDFSFTIAINEHVISRRAVELFKKNLVTGVTYGPILLGKKSSIPSTEWFQMIINDASVESSPSTKFGLDPFDSDEKGEYRCANGHKFGLNILSELSVMRDSVSALDFTCTRQFIGQRGESLFRPYRLILVSQKVRKIIEENNLKGCCLEVAHME
jgi:hypothetical protein